MTAIARETRTGGEELLAGRCSPQDALDRLEVSDLVYQDLAFSLPLVNKLIGCIAECTSPGGRVLLIGPHPLLPLALRDRGYQVSITRFGDGYFPRELEPLVVAELSDSALAEGRLPPLGTYETVVLPLVVEHLRENPELLLRTLRSHLAEAGHIVLATSNLGKLGTRLRASMGKGFLPDWKSEPVHQPGGWPAARIYRFYLDRELASWSNEAGYAVERSIPVDGQAPYWPPVPLSVIQFAAAKGKQWVKRLVPGLQDHIIMTLRVAPPRLGLPPLKPAPQASPLDYPFVSVVVPTRDRAHMLPDALEGLFEQSYPPDRYEVIVINDGSTDKTGEVIAEYAVRAPCRFITENTGGVGTATARNRGSRLANGDIVAHTDDDCRTPPGWLLGGVEGFEQNVAFVSGPIYPDPRDTWKFFSFVMWQPVDTGTYPTSNIFYRRDVVEGEGGFDESFGVNLLGRPVWGWDSDFAWRLIRKGYERRFRPEASLTSRIFPLTPKRWLLEGWRAVMLPGVVRQVPELRRTLLTAGLFHTKDSAAFELGAVASAAAFLSRKPALLLLWLPWLRIAVSYARPDWFPPFRWLRLAAKVACVFGQHSVYASALVWGSIKARRPVL